MCGPVRIDAASRVAGLVLLCAAAAIGCGRSEEPVKLCEPPGACDGFRDDEGPRALPEGDARKGQALYAAHCATCHGAGGHGAASKAKGDFTDPSWHKGYSDEDIARTVSRGRGAMPKLALPPEDLAHIIAYARSLAVVKEPPAKGY